MLGASPFGRTAPWQAAVDQGGQEPPPPPTWPPGPPSGPPPSQPPGPPPPPSTNAGHQLEDALEVFLLQRQVRLHQVYGMGLRSAFADLAARSMRREWLIRCLWSWLHCAAWSRRQEMWAETLSHADERSVLRAEAAVFTPGQPLWTQKVADAFQ